MFTIMAIIEMIKKITVIFFLPISVVIIDKHRNAKITSVAVSFGSQDQYEPHDIWAQIIPEIKPNRLKNQEE
jgi:hypothetical protein